MKISIVVAVAMNRVIGYHGKLPWREPRELAYFKRITMNKPVIMGRKTFQSLKRPLPGRHNIVISNTLRSPSAVSVTKNLADAFDVAHKDNATEVMIIGGRSVYLESLPYADHLYITLVNTEPKGDTYIDLGLPELLGNTPGNQGNSNCWHRTGFFSIAGRSCEWLKFLRLERKPHDVLSI